MKMFSRPVYSGWKPVPSSRMAEDFAVDGNASAAVQRPGQDLKQSSSLPYAIAAENADNLAFADLEIDVAQGPELFVAIAARNEFPNHVQGFRIHLAALLVMAFNAYRNVIW